MLQNLTNGAFKNKILIILKNIGAQWLYSSSFKDGLLPPALFIKSTVWSQARVYVCAPTRACVRVWVFVDGFNVSSCAGDILDIFH